MNKSIGLPFKAELVSKVLDGSKSQTRRLPGMHNCRLLDGKKDVTGKMRGLDWDRVVLGYRFLGEVVTAVPRMLRDCQPDVITVWHPESRKYLELASRHEPGDIAWMREKHYFTIFGEVPSIHYAAGNILMEDVNEYASGMSEEEFDRTFGRGDGKWRSSIHMPRQVSRKEMILTGVRIELIQDISAEDVVAEGIPSIGPILANTAMLITGTDNLEYCKRKMKIDMFAELWDSINSARGWAWSKNLPVVVYNWGKVLK